MKNHARDIWACDFTVAYEWSFRPWYIFVVMELRTRRIVHTAITKSLTDEWTAQQLREAIPWGKGPKYLIHDRDSKYGSHFLAVAAGAGIKELKTPYRAPRANGICEKFMGSLRRECLDNTLILQGKHLQRVLKNIPFTSIRNGLIRELVNTSPTIKICLSQTQPGGLPPKLSLAGYITVILA